MNKILRMTFLLALAVSFCPHFAFADEAEQVDPAKLQEIVQRESTAKTRPEKLTDEEIAEWLVVGSSRTTKLKDPKTRIFKWDGPLRVLIQDQDGKDMDLSVYPGSMIKQYLTTLAGYTKIPLSITTAEAKDNNVSIVMTKAWQDPIIVGEAGALRGVSEIQPEDRTFGEIRISPDLPKGWLPKGPVDNTDYCDWGCFPPFGSYRIFHVDHTIKACKILIRTTTSILETWERIPTALWGVLNSQMINCLGVQSHLISYNRDPQTFSNHSFFFLRYLYSPDLKSGMKPKIGKNVLLRLIEKQQ